MSNTTETNNTKTPVIFLDTVGRTIMGILSDTTDDKILNVSNPVVIMVGGDNTGKMTVQLFPLFFREFLADKNTDVVFSYKKDTVTFSDINAIDFRLQAQYTQMFSKANTFGSPEAQHPATEQKVVNLFDE
jgi:hypothetical protein